MPNTPLTDGVCVAPGSAPGAPCRGDDPRWIWQVRALARTAGALFVRAYERGERVYVAMLARGYGFGVPRAGGCRGGQRHLGHRQPQQRGQ